MSDWSWLRAKKSKADIYVRSYREQFGLCNYDSLFFCCLFTLVLSCLYFLCKWNYFWAWPSYTRILLKKTSYSYSYAYQRHLLCSCRLLLRRMLTPECLFIYFQHRVWVKNKYRPFVPSFVSSYCPRCKGSRVSPSPVLCATDSLKGCPVLYAFSC